MSSRALRKAQKERDALVHQEDAAADEDDGEEPQPASRRGVFAMLEEVENEEVNDETHSTGDSDDDDAPLEGQKSEPSAEVEALAKRRKTKKKKKKKPKQASAASPDVDEIDAALQSLSANDDAKSEIPNSSARKAASETVVLAVEPYHLQVSNEMRRLFGKAAFSAEQEEREDLRRRAPDGQHVALCDAVSGRMAQNGPGLSAILRKRNIFVQGREEWPKNTANGLTMELDHRDSSGVATYRFVHNSQYKVTQMEFAQGVAMMDPNNLINMLRFNPYHVATLLQVSEIAKQEKDYATTGELLERALFSFGKGVHPSFVKDLEKGTARLEFRRSENREFYLAAWRYIGNIGMRATWRTAYEWARLLYALDPANDPYCMGLMIDQLALRAHQPESLLALIDAETFEVGGISPSIAYSGALALQMCGKKAEAREQLTTSVLHFPWVAARLYQQIDATLKLPPVIWGKTAKTDKDVLYTELYVNSAQDIWKLPDALAFLTETVSSIIVDAAEREALAEQSVSHAEISIDEARHILLLDKPTLIGLLPRELTNLVDSMSDPLPPHDSEGLEEGEADEDVANDRILQMAYERLESTRNGTHLQAIIDAMALAEGPE